MATKPRKRVTSAGNVRWEIVIRKVGYPQVSKMFKTEKEAKAWSVETEAAINKGTYDFGDRLRKKMATAHAVGTQGSVAELSDRMTLSELFTVYFKKYGSGLKDGGHRDKHRTKPIVEYMGDVRLCDLSKGTVLEYATMRLNSRGFRKAGNVSGGTVKHEVNLIKRVINIAQDFYGVKLEGGNPAVFSQGSPISKRLRGGQRDRVLRDAAEEGRLLTECKKSSNKELLSIVLLAIETAMRKGEILALRWKFIDLDRKIIYIPVEHDKAGEGRYVALTDAAVEILKGIRESCIDAAGDELLFKSKYDHVQRCFTKACMRAEISDLRMHDLRHTAITRTVNRTGMHILQLMQYSGHKSMQMVKRYYKDDIDDVVSVLNRKS